MRPVGTLVTATAPGRSLTVVAVNYPNEDPREEWLLEYLAGVVKNLVPSLAGVTPRPGEATTLSSRPCRSLVWELPADTKDAADAVRRLDVYVTRRGRTLYALMAAAGGAGRYKDCFSLIE